MNKELKRLAQNARNRMIRKGEKLDNKLPSLSSNVKFKVISSSDADEIFNSKAKEVLENGSLNPISELMDLTYFSSLDTVKKEKYLLDIVEKYNRFKDKFEGKIEQKFVY